MRIKKLYDKEGNVYTPLVSVDSVYDGDHSVKQLIEDSVKYPELYRTLSRYMTITINTSDWVGYTCRKNIPGMTSHMSVIVQPDSLSQTEYVLNGVQCTSQGENYLDFTCTSVPTTDLVINVLGIKSVPFRPVVSLVITGDWSNPQYTGSAIDYEGLTFTAIYSDGSTEVVIPDSVSPSEWTSTPGIQIATFYYLGVSATKSANVIDIKRMPLTLEAANNGTISIDETGSPGTVYYSLNNGAQTEIIGSAFIQVTTGDKVSVFRTLSNDLSSRDYISINCTNNCYVYGNIMSLIDKDDYSDLDTIEYSYALYNLFNGNTWINIDKSVGDLILPATTLAEECYSSMFQSCTSLTTTPELPATTLAEGCYMGMFSGCTSLTTAPELPATTLAFGCYMGIFMDCTSLTTAPELSALTLTGNCYAYMFYGCTSLTTPPELPATTLDNQCYYYMFVNCTSLTTAPSRLPATTLSEGCYVGMFMNCTSLTTAPELPATTLTDSCYHLMFNGCTNLATPPELPATTLAEYCYASMFGSCTSLTTAPELPATTLVNYCYGGMFSGCTNLNEITCLATSTSATDCTKNWVNGVSSAGTFYKDSSMISWTIGDSGIPLGWTIIDK